MYFPVSALLIEYMILSVVESRDSYGYEISQTVKKAADIKESTDSCSLFSARFSLLYIAVADSQTAPVSVFQHRLSL